MQNQIKKTNPTFHVILTSFLTAAERFTLIFFFSDDQLILSLIDFAFPALTALSTTVTFLIQQICHEPEVQRKIQDEIDHVVGQGRLPTLDDRIK